MYSFLKKRIVAAFLSIFTLAAPISSAIITTPVVHAQSCSVVENTPENIYGFEISKNISVNNRPILHYIHKKSGAQVIVEPNNNIEKSFEISFRTLPENNKGANHIIEHSCLNGSHEYPYKNMVLELMNVAYTTFLNAITSSTYTTYPVSSIDEEELESLAKIYTSGVFHPLFLSDERIFKKEGIRFETDENGRLKANGTVFNEMQQNFLGTDKLLERIFPDTFSKNMPGGIPDKIMDLSYNEICKTYKKYYHPANCVIHITGNINYKKIFKWLDSDYLSSYDKNDFSKPEFKHQNIKNIKKYDHVSFYKQSSESSLSTVSVAYIFDSNVYLDNAEMLKFVSQLIQNPNSSRCKFLKEKGYTNIKTSICTLFSDPIALLEFQSDNSDILTEPVISNVLNELFESFPITEEECEQFVNKNDFKEAKIEATKSAFNIIDTASIMFCFNNFNDPLPIQAINNKHNQKNTDMQEINKLIKNIFCKENRIITVLDPSSDEKLNNGYKISEKLKLLEPQAKALTADSIDQKKWIDAPNNAAELKKLKSMFKKLSNLKIPESFCELKKSNNISPAIYESIQDIGDFCEFKFVFNMNHISGNDKKYLSLLNYFFSFGDTDVYSREQLENKLADKSSVSAQFNVHPNIRDEKNAFFTINVITREKDIDEIFDCLNRQINHIKYNDSKHLQDFSNQALKYYTSMPKPIMEMYEILSGEFSNEAVFSNGLQSVEDRKKFIENISANLDNEEYKKDLSQALLNLKNKICNKNSLQGIAICASEKNAEAVKNHALKFADLLSTENISGKNALQNNESPKKSRAFISPAASNNQIICIANSKELAQDTGFKALCQKISTSFLMPEIREKSGAYGASISPEPNTGKIIISSWQDPQIKKTVDVFKSIPDFIKNHNYTEEETSEICKAALKNFLPSSDRLNTFDAQAIFRICCERDYCRETNDKINEIKKITPQNLKSYAEKLKDALKTMRIYALSGGITRKEDAALFDEITE